MTIKDEVSEFLRNSGTPATPKHIAEAIGRGTAGNISRALLALTAEGKLIKYKTGKQNSWRVYQWNPDYTDSKFTVGSEWKTRGGEKAVVTCSPGGGMFFAVVAGYEYVYLTNGEFRGSQRQYDIIAPWSEPKPEEKSELRKAYDDWLERPEPHRMRIVLEAIITAIKELQKPRMDDYRDAQWETQEEIITIHGHRVYLVRLQDGTWSSYSVAEPWFCFYGATRDKAIEEAEKGIKFAQEAAKPVAASKLSGEAWANIYKSGTLCAHPTRETADAMGTINRIACVRVPWVEGEGL